MKQSNFASYQNTRKRRRVFQKICLRFFHAFIFECAKVWAIWKTTRPEQQTKVFIWLLNVRLVYVHKQKFCALSF